MVPLTAGRVANMAMLFGIVMLARQIGGFFGAFLGGYVFQVTGSDDGVWVIHIMLTLGAGRWALGAGRWALGAALVSLPIREALLPRQRAVV